MKYKYIVQYIVNISYDILYTIEYIVYCVLCIVYYTLYTIYYR